MTLDIYNQAIPALTISCVVLYCDFSTVCVWTGFQVIENKTSLLGKLNFVIEDFHTDSTCNCHTNGYI